MLKHACGGQGPLFNELDLHMNFKLFCKHAHLQGKRSLRAMHNCTPLAIISVRA